MAIRIVRLGTPRGPQEGLRIGTVRRPPRGVRKEEYAGRDFYDVWLPELAPSAPLVSYALSQPFTPDRWTTYEKRYLGEMRKPEPHRLILLLAALSKQADFSVGCYCEDESICHRSLLRRILIENGAQVMTGEGAPIQASWHLYVIRTVDGFLYAGISTDVRRRFKEHLEQGRNASKYLLSHKPAEVAFSVAVGDKGLALKVEYRFKRLSKTVKERIVAAGKVKFDPCSGKIRVPR